MKELRKDESVVLLIRTSPGKWHPPVSVFVISQASDARDDMMTYWLIQPPVNPVSHDLDDGLSVLPKLRV